MMTLTAVMTMTAVMTAVTPVAWVASTLHS